MPEIFVDGDACPVTAEVIRVAERHDLVVHVVSNRGRRPSSNPKVHSVMVPELPDAADNWIAGRIGTDDIAITADILLADRCLKRDARVLRPNGKPYTVDNIGDAVATRDLMSHLRDTGEISGRSRPFSKEDRSKFLQALETMVRR